MTDKSKYLRAVLALTLASSRGFPSLGLPQPYSGAATGQWPAKRGVSVATCFRFFPGLNAAIRLAQPKG
jgi:hypothetical protein